MDSSRERFDAELRPILDLAFGVANRLTRDRDAAMDLVQDAAVQAYKGFHTFEAGTNFKAWFLRVLTNRFYKVRKRDASRPGQVGLDDAEDVFLYQQAQKHGERSGEDPVATLLESVGVDEVEAALADLPEDFREVCALYFSGELSYDEIAETLGIPVGTVRSRIHRGRKLLQKSLWNLAVERGLVSGEAPSE